MQPAAGASIQDVHHAAAYIAYVHAALPDILIVHIVQPSGKNLFGPFHSRGAAGPGGYVVTDFVGEGLVLQKGDLKQQDVGIRPFGTLAQAAQFVLGQHHGHIVQRALPEGIAHDAVQPGGAVVDLLYRADRNPRGCGYTGKCIHMSLL